jgi:hypothetical protein
VKASRHEQRAAYLRAQVEPGETILAAGWQGIVTDRRLLFGWELHGSRVGEWTHDALAFDEITGWSEGRRHDVRPLLRLEHPVHRRLDWVPAHRFLWFRWGNATGERPYEETTFAFGSRRSPVLLALKERLELAGVRQGESFVVRLPGTRAERIRGSRAVAVFRPDTRLSRIRRRVVELDERLHRGQLAWRVRLPSWLLLAVPAWFINRWLVVPAVLVAELAWIAGLQWSWHRERHRRPAAP